MMAPSTHETAMVSKPAEADERPTWPRRGTRLPRRFPLAPRRRTGTKDPDEAACEHIDQLVATRAGKSAASLDPMPPSPRNASRTDRRTRTPATRDESAWCSAVGACARVYISHGPNRSRRPRKCRQALPLTLLEKPRRLPPRRHADRTNQHRRGSKQAGEHGQPPSAVAVTSDRAMRDRPRLRVASV